MHKNIILGLVVLLFAYTATNAVENNIDLNLFDNIYYETNDSSISTSSEKKCKTMQNGVCVESRAGDNSNKQNEPTKQDMRQINKKIPNKSCEYRFGFGYILDPYANVWSTWAVYNQSKVFITNVEMNSAALRAGLKVGDEIKKINDIRVVKFKKNDFTNYLNGQQSIKLEIKSVDGSKKNINLTRSEICTTRLSEPLFDSYWQQVCPYDLDWWADYLTAVGKVSNNLTAQSQNEYSATINEVNSWIRRKSQFRNGFNVCLNNNYNMNDVNACLNQLVVRALNIIANEQNLELQRSAVRAQQQIQQQQINALNNYAYSLRNQQVNVNSNINVNHSGTMNVNHSGTIYLNPNYRNYYGW